MKILILAGGEGKRLWPLSTKQYPKQFIHLGDHESLLRKTVKRFYKKGLIENVFIVTNQEYALFILEDLQDLDSSIGERIIIEPYSKNTGPAITWSVRSLLLMKVVSKEESIVTVPIDHIFSNEDEAMNLIIDAGGLLEEGSIITFGVKCTKPETGYGYIKAGNRLSLNYYKVDSFIEKPQKELAEKFFKEGGWFWNVGIFLFSIRTFLEELKANVKPLYQMNTSLEYKNIHSISIDHAVIEKFSNVRVIELVGIDWFDIGSWHSLYDFLQEDKKGKLQLGNVANSNTKKYFFSADKNSLSGRYVSIIEEDSRTVIFKN